jgi:hypothetical protein
MRAGIGRPVWRSLRKASTIDKLLIINRLHLVYIHDTGALCQGLLRHKLKRLITVKAPLCRKLKQPFRR